MSPTAIPYHPMICYRCLESEREPMVWQLTSRGYGSHFDGTTSRLQLCSQCCDDTLRKTLTTYFNETPDESNGWQDYLYEDALHLFIQTLPLAGQELFRNATTGHFVMDAQDWINIQLGIANDEAYSRNGLQSPSELQAYRTRFPHCQHVALIEIDEDTAYTQCPYGVYGEIDGSSSLDNEHSQCYHCSYYTPASHLTPRRLGRALAVIPKAVKMYELFCPTCHRAHYRHAHLLNLEGESTLRCLCGQDLIFDMDIYEPWHISD